MFFIFRVRQIFTKLRQVFIEALILNYFNLNYYIQITTNASSYMISEIFSQLTLDNSDRWYLMIFFSQKIIPTKT